jgi:Uma2 family endonuclease
LAHVFPELRVTFSGRSFVPDIAVLRTERIPLDDRGRFANDIFEPPDIAVEIVSPELGVNPLIRRCRWFVANGVGVALLVDPADESVVAFRPGNEISEWHDKDKIDLSDVLPDFDLTVEQLFASLRPAPSEPSNQ